MAIIALVLFLAVPVRGVLYSHEIYLTSSARRLTPPSLFHRTLESLSIVWLVLTTLVRTAIMGKLYTNCLVAVLNNRQRRNSSNGERATSVRLSDIPSVRLSDVPKDRWNASRSDSGAICVSVVRDVDVQWEDAKPVHDATQRPMPRRLEPLRPKSWKQSTPSVPANWGVQVRIRWRGVVVSALLTDD